MNRKITEVVCIKGVEVNYPIELFNMISTGTELYFVKFYLKFTQRKFLCTNRKEPEFYFYDEGVGVWIETGAQICIMKLIRDEVEPYLNNVLENTFSLSDSRDHREMAEQCVSRLKKLIARIGSPNFMIGVIKTLASELPYKHPITFDEQIDYVQFKNGAVSLKTGVFKKRTEEDYVTKTLDYEYSEVRDEDAVDFVLKTVARTSNDDEICVKQNLCWLAYCLTGETNEQKCMFFIGEKAQNGKSTLIAMYEAAFPIYVKKISRDTFNKNNTKRHKQFHDIKKIRMVYTEELGQKQDVDTIKDFVDGYKIGGNEVLYGTTEDIPIQAKLTSISNKSPLFKTDNGMERRGILVRFTNKFVSKLVYDELEDKAGHHIAVKSLREKMQQNKYKLALFQLLLPYAKRYFKKGLYINPKYEQAWKETCGENDKFQSFIDSRYVKTGCDCDRIGKDQITSAYRQYAGLKSVSWMNVLNEIKRIGLKYERKLRCDGVQGCVVGLQDRYDAAVEVVEKPEIQEKETALEVKPIINVNVYINRVKKKIFRDVFDFEAYNEVERQKGLGNIDFWFQQFSELEKQFFSKCKCRGCGEPISSLDKNYNTFICRHCSPRVYKGVNEKGWSVDRAIRALADCNKTGVSWQSYLEKEP